MPSFQQNILLKVYNPKNYFVVAVSAAITTPLDVAKTRIMLSSTTADKKEVKISTMLKKVYRDNGPKGYGQIAFFYYFKS